MARSWGFATGHGLRVVGLRRILVNESPGFPPGSTNQGLLDPLTKHRGRATGPSHPTDHGTDANALAHVHNNRWPPLSLCFANLTRRDWKVRRFGVRAF